MFDLDKLFMATEEKKKVFLCGCCSLKIAYDYFGSKPSFCRDIVLLEDAYIKKDPFSEEKRMIILGSHCSVCGKAVCVSQECSLFYTKRFCLGCVQEGFADFPMEIQKEVEKIGKKI